MNIGDLKQRQSLPLEQKIIKSIRTIEQFYEMYEGDVYISKGGVDSNIVEWLMKQSRYKDIECVCVASVEPTENIKHNFELGNTLLKSTITKKQVIKDWGYPLISKQVAMSISRYARTKDPNVRKFRLTGDRGDGKKYTVGVIPTRYRELIYAPFEISENCCNKIKKKPLHEYDKKSGKYPITGEMASESREREKHYLKHGCIMHDRKNPKCTPVGFWTTQDIMQCIYENNIEIPTIYGKVIKPEHGTFKFTREQRTGCEMCAFGIMFDAERFERLKERKPNLYKQMMEGGEWEYRNKFRLVKPTPGSLPIWSNRYWVPNNEGYGYRFVLNYFYEVMKIDRKIE